MLAARELSRPYGETVVLEPLDLEVGAGEPCCLLGPNGAGKTTMPPLALQRLFERLAGNDLTTALAYRDGIARYHELLRHPRVYRAQGLSVLHVDQLPRHHASSDEVDAPLPGWAGLLGFLLLNLAFAPRAVRRLEGLEGPEATEAGAQEVKSVVGASSRAVGG